MGLETGEWCRCRSSSLTPPGSLRSHGSRPRPTRHNRLAYSIAMYRNISFRNPCIVIRIVLPDSCQYTTLMLILSTQRVVLHPSYLQKVFSFIRFIKEKYSFTILSKNSSAPGGMPWAELKSDEHLSPD